MKEPPPAGGIYQPGHVIYPRLISQPRYQLITTHIRGTRLRTVHVSWRVSFCGVRPPAGLVVIAVFCGVRPNDCGVLHCGVTPLSALTGSPPPRPRQAAPQYPRHHLPLLD